jgi:Ca-activated chloride channel family protein
MKRIVTILLATALAMGAGAERDEDAAVLWPEQERSFLFDGPGLLLSEEAREELLSAPADERREAIEKFLGRDPIPETPANELVEGIENRRRLVFSELFTFLDDRARILFLHGSPVERKEIECGQTFVPLEVWTYPTTEVGLRLLFYRPTPTSPFRLWLPLDSKRALYTREMEYWLEQYEELKKRIRSKRFDLITCSETRLVDAVTGVEGLFGYRAGRPTNEDLMKVFDPPEDLALWARSAAATAIEMPSELPIEAVTVLFPDRVQQRIVTRFFVTVPAGVELGVISEEGVTEHRLAVEGLVEQEGEIFDKFRVRFKLPPTDEDLPIALAVERALRPERNYLARLHVVDEISGGEARINRGFRVPEEPQVIEEPPVPEEAIVALGEELAEKRIAGKDSLLLAPPESEVIFGTWRAETLISGTRISKVVFLVDGQVQLTKTRPPFSAEVRLSKFPTEQIVRAEGYDESDQLVAADEVVVNQPRGSFRVRVIEPARGTAVAGRIEARAEVVVPDERRVAKVEFFLNEELVATRKRVPWLAAIDVPPTGEISYLTVVAILDNGSRAEDVRFLNAPGYLEQVDVNLVELLTTVADRSNRPVKGLSRESFEVFENGRPQQIEKFELVEDLPLSVGITIDTSGSMAMSLPEAQKAAVGFLENIITPKDRAFAVGFAGEPILLIPPTDDVRAVEAALGDLRSVGWTALHDAVVTSLYYFRGIRGRRALILLSDGDDSASHYAFRDALEYAHRSGVVVYPVGLGVSGVKTGIRRKLNQLAEETGGRAFYIQQAEELSTVYEEIEEELRSQYLLTYSSDKATGDESFRTVEVKMKEARLKARTIRGYYL